MLPIVQRELHVAARNPKLYRSRILSASIVICIVAMILLFNTNPRSTDRFFQNISSLALLVCLAEGVRKTSDAISIEKREGTLGLLFLSTLGGADITLGKLAAAAIRSLGTFFGLIPVFAICLLMGGVTGAEFWRTMLVLTLTLIMSLSVCLFLSSVTREGAQMGAIFLLAALCIAPGISQLNASLSPWILPLSPFYAHRSGLDAYYSVDPGAYWRGVGYLAGLSIVSLAATSFIVPRSWQDRAIREKPKPRLAGPLPPSLAELRRAMLDRNPIMWLMFNPRSHRAFRLFLIALLVVVILGTAAVLYVIDGSLNEVGIELLFPSLGLGVLVLVCTLRVARATSRNFVEARSNGALELILSTPVKVRQIIAGQWLAIRADLFPAFIIFSILGALVLLYVSILGEWAQLAYTVYALLGAVFGLVTVGSVGIWMGLTAKTPGRAFFRTVIFGFLAPHLICTPTLVNQLVVFLLAMDKVNVHFRRFVASQYLANTPSLAAVSPTPPNTPPVLRHGMP